MTDKFVIDENEDAHVLREMAKMIKSAEDD